MLEQQPERAQEAEAAYRKAMGSGHIEWVPHAAYNLAKLLERQGRVADAEPVYRTIIDSGHEKFAPWAANSLALLRQRQGQAQSLAAQPRTPPTHERVVAGQQRAPSPPRPGPLSLSRVALEAALLNLSGVSAGYVFLRYWRRAVRHLVLTVALIFLALSLDASRRPALWTAIFAVWVAWMAVDGKRQADRLTHDPVVPAESPAPFVAAGVLLATVVVAFGLYRTAGARTFERGLTDHEGGDCGAAVDQYQRVTSTYELTLLPSVATGGMRGLPGRRTSAIQ
ncbi:MAG: hypothetical protein ACRDZO_18735 [Egibacteraceae bacterium]